MLILGRLADDICTEFVTGETVVTQVVVEVARELKEFSGKTAKEIASELNSRMKDFKSTVAYLEKHAPDLALNGGLIRKARIAMDMNWQCPFTGQHFEPNDLRHMEREHIIPFASRNTNALNALVLTSPEINRWKGKRTARQFILDEGGKPVPNRENLSVFTVTQYEAFVDHLDTKGHPDDIRRKKARKALLLTTDMDDKDLGFTEGKLTQTSQLAKLAMRGLKQRFPNAIIDPIPGPVTAELRKTWDLIGTLSLVCPEILHPSLGELESAATAKADKELKKRMKSGELEDSDREALRETFLAEISETEREQAGRAKPKADIRGLTHMHHALDAATIAFAAHYFPLRKHGEDQKGKLWRALLKRSRTPVEKNLLLATGLFKTYQKERRDHEGTVIETRPEVALRDLPATLKNALRQSLAQARVMQHLPADQSGTKAELTTWGIVSREGEGEAERITLRQNALTVEDNRRIRELKTREERAGKLLGPNPKNGTGKLAEIKGAMIIGENYGLALDPVPTVIPFHDVPARLKELRQANGGKPVRVLRNGLLFNLDGWPGKNGIWRILSCKASLTLDLARADELKASWREVSVKSLSKRGMKLLVQNYTGHLVTS